MKISADNFCPLVYGATTAPGPPQESARPRRCPTGRTVKKQGERSFPAKKHINNSIAYQKAKNKRA